MSDRDDTLPRHKDDFDRVYDLEDPSPYYNALRSSGYRMPTVVAGALKASHERLCAARGTKGTLRLLDFACGYGAIGALLRHDVSMSDLYSWYGARHWRPADGRRHREADTAFFSARRAPSAPFEVGGVDVAGAALEYAAALGFLDRAFHENLVDAAPGDELVRFLRGVHLVIESGSLGGQLPVVFARILDCCAGERSPWFLYGLRPDVDRRPLDRMWATRGYRTDRIGTGPVRYRRPLGARERDDMLRLARKLGGPHTPVMEDGYLLVELALARPASDDARIPIVAMETRSD